MNKITLVLLALVLNGCAHKTIHEGCSDKDVLSHYQDYNECYSEESSRHARKQKAWAEAWDGMGKQAQSKPLNCNTQQYGSFTDIRCN